MIEAPGPLMHYHAEVLPMVTLAKMAQNQFSFVSGGHFIHRMG
jgi:hypothetical protein